ncbi:MAG: 4a-hydroxytetrahydrobiopterin dehydratase [Spartobacteria bacterium]
MEPTLSTAEIHAALQSLPGWEHRNGRLVVECRCPDFAQAFGFMTSAALEAARKGHHPDGWNSYNKVRIELVTHSAKGITEKDILLAQKFQQLATRRADLAGGITRSEER